MDKRPKKSLDEFDIEKYPLEVIDQRDRHRAIMESLEAQKRFSVSKYRVEEQEWLKEAEFNDMKQFKENKLNFLKVKYKHHFVELSRINREEHIKNNSWRISKRKKSINGKSVKSIYKLPEKKGTGLSVYLGEKPDSAGFKSTTGFTIVKESVRASSLRNSYDYSGTIRECRSIEQQKIQTKHKFTNLFKKTENYKSPLVCQNKPYKLFLQQKGKSLKAGQVGDLTSWINTYLTNKYQKAEMKPSIRK